jgi:penicillin-binding protein 1A
LPLELYKGKGNYSHLISNIPKNEILAMYCNVYYFKSSWVSSGAQTYFSKEPKLDIEESAILGMFKNSGLYNPATKPVGVKNRRNVVLAQMAKRILLRKKKERLQSLPLLLILNWKAIEKDQQLISERLRDYMKNGLMKTRSPTDLIMTSTKMD